MYHTGDHVVDKKLILMRGQLLVEFMKHKRNFEFYAIKELEAFVNDFNHPEG